MDKARLAKRIQFHEPHMDPHSMSWLVVGTLQVAVHHKVAMPPGNGSRAMSPAVLAEAKRRIEDGIMDALENA